MNGSLTRCVVGHLLLLAGLALLVCTAAQAAEPAPPGDVGVRHTFEIGKDDFLLDGKPFVVRCGEIHFPRVPREYWEHRLEMCKAMGLNTVCVYLFWNFHEWHEGVFDWSGQADVAEFCSLAQKHGLWVILRPGPYSCAEWEMGGMPWWLLKHDSNVLRTTNPAFLVPAARYLKEVGRVLAPFQITRGGPLLMVQVENEYGSFGKDAKYMGALRQATLDAGFDVPLFACNPQGALANGYRDDLFQVVNFGARAAPRAFEALRRFQKTGPLMNGEYYPGWFDTWGGMHRTGDVKTIVGDLDYMLKHRHSFSIYMAHGGTSFGMWAGADRPFKPDTSSYDYDAPISEAGWVTPKFTAIRELLAKYLQSGESLPDPPPANPVMAIPPFRLKAVAPLFDNLPAAPAKDDVPHTMEFYGQSRGCTLYRTILPAAPAGWLEVKEVHDYAWIYLDGNFVGVMDRRGKRYRVKLPAHSAGARLDILVEAVGRVNFGAETYDRKGLHAPVTFTSIPVVPPANTADEKPDEAKELRGWQIFSFPLDNAELASLRYKEVTASAARLPASILSAPVPSFYKGEFTLGKTGDTFLDLRGWSKGVLWINGHCLGRFWNIGPTQTMYCPGPWLKAGLNEVVVLDLMGPTEPVLAGLEKPILDLLRPELDFARKARAAGNFTPDGSSLVAEGAFTAEIQWQEKRFTTPTRGRYLCFEALNSHDGKEFAAMAELDAIDGKGEIIAKSDWTILWVDSEELSAAAGEAENILDGQPASFWHSEYSGQKPGFPHRMVIDLGLEQTLGGIRYMPRGGGARENGRIKDYRVRLSDKPFGLSSQP
ncbi:MAG TPA: beta-galactosidase [Candidatus Methylacidiphilales bacterium]|nr:beta-galactosidase [Candidatus Methylacidiphilales bacterium]